MRHQQHFLTQTDGYAALLASLPIRGRRVVEFGVGNGELTTLILAQEPAAVIGYEIDPTLDTPVHPVLTVHHEDLTAADLSWLRPADAVIANPPYALLDVILGHIGRVGIRDVVLMMPEGRAGALPGGRVRLRLDGAAFSPPSTGTHLVVVAGFDATRPESAAE
jgi:16S rRNA A1518/A1519 N6-dimethyltransferase RsmA/KsgA/DIM1 with predicted DNA glycosylase/AP lyase activity